MKIVNPLQQYKCPFCHQTFKLRDCAIVAKSGKEMRPARQGLRGLVIESVNKMEFVKELASRQCPHCKKLLPPNFEDVDNFIIAIVGDSFSGKTHHIASTIYELQQGRLQQQGRFFRFMPMTQEIQEKYQLDFYDHLIKRREPMPANQPTFNSINDPLIYRLTIDAGTKESVIKDINLLIYDISGEDIAHQNQMVQYGQFILHADAMIFLADPMTMPNLVDQMPFHLRSTAFSGRSSATVFNSVMQLFEQARGLRPGELSPIPIAITVSKSDLLKTIRVPGQNQHHFLQRPPFYGVQNIRDQQIVDAEIREIIRLYGDGGLLFPSDPNIQYFASSSTGWAPDPQGKYPAIHPCRCLDPLLWILWRLNIIEGMVW